MGQTNPSTSALPVISTPPPLPAGNAAPRGISPRKLILGVILAGSVLLFFMVLLAGGVAILHEAAPRGGGRASFAGVVLAIRHVIAHHLSFHGHKK
jgi:hypothetical protein